MNLDKSYKLCADILGSVELGASLIFLVIECWRIKRCQIESKMCLFVCLVGIISGIGT